MKFVSLLGGLTRRFAANPFDVIQRLAEKTGAEAYLLPVPFFANSIADKKVLLSQLGIGEVLDMADAASLLIVGIGEASAESFLHMGGMVGAEEIEAVRESRRGRRGARPFLHARWPAHRERPFRPRPRARTRTGSEGEGSWP